MEHGSVFKRKRTALKAAQSGSPMSKTMGVLLSVSAVSLDEGSDSFLPVSAEQAKWDADHQTDSAGPSRGRKKARPIVIDSDSYSDSDSDSSPSLETSDSEEGAGSAYYGGYGRCYSCGKSDSEHWQAPHCDCQIAELSITLLPLEQLTILLGSLQP